MSVLFDRVRFYELESSGRISDLNMLTAISLFYQLTYVGISVQCRLLHAREVKL